MELSLNTPAIDLILANQSANENITSSFAENKLTGLSIDTGGHQNIVKLSSKFIFDCLRAMFYQHFDKDFKYCTRGMDALPKIEQVVQALINLGSASRKRYEEFFEKFPYSPSEIWLALKFI